MFFEASVSFELRRGEREVSLNYAQSGMKNDVENAAQKYAHMVFLLDYKTLKPKTREFVRRSLRHNEVIEETHTMVAPRGKVKMGFRLQCDDLSQVSELLLAALKIMFPGDVVFMLDLSARHVEDEEGNHWATLWRKDVTAVCPVRNCQKVERLPNFGMVAQA